MQHNKLNKIHVHTYIDIMQNKNKWYLLTHTESGREQRKKTANHTTLTHSKSREIHKTDSHTNIKSAP